MYIGLLYIGCYNCSSFYSKRNTDSMEFYLILDKKEEYLIDTGIRGVIFASYIK